MKTVGEFKKAGVVFVEGDECKDDDYKYTKGWVLDKFQHFDECQVTSFAWRDLTTKPDNPNFKIELDIDNHRWRPSLNQGVEYPYEQRVTFRDEYMEYLENARKDGITKPMTRVEYVKHLAGIPASAVATDSGEAAKPPEFKAGDLVDIHFPEGTYRENMEIVYIDDTFINAISIDEGTPFTKLRKNITVKRNDRLNELKDIIGLHDDPTECAKAILAAGYTK